MDTGPLSIKDVCLGNVAEQSWLERALWQQRQSPIPPALKSNVLAWWDAGWQKDILLPLNQLIPSMVDTNANNLADGWTSDAPTLSFSAGVQRFTASAQYQFFNNATVIQSQSVGDVVYFRADVTASSASVALIVGEGTGGTNKSKSHSATAGKETLSVIGTVASKADSKVRIQDNRVSSWDEISIEKPMFLNLSVIFGKGNEPTAAEMDDILAQDGNQCWEGTRNVKVNPSGKYYVYDASGNGRIAKLYNMAYNAASGPQAGPPKHWKGDGVDDWMGRAQSGFIAQDADFSYVCVFSPSADNATTRLLYGFNTDFVTAPVFRLSWIGGEFECSVYDRIDGARNAYYTTAILASSYYSVVVAYSQTDKKFRIYFNGNLVATSTAISNGHAAINYVRSWRDLAGSAYTGQKMGVVSPFDKYVSADEAKTIHNKLASRFGMTPVA